MESSKKRHQVYHQFSALAGLGEIAWRRGQFGQAADLYNQLISMGRSQKVAAMEAFGLECLRDVFLSRGDYAAAEDMCDEIFRRSQELKDEVRTANTWIWRGFFLWEKYEDEQAAQIFAQVLAKDAERLKNSGTIRSWCLLGLARESLRLGDYAQARAQLTQAITPGIDRDELSHIIGTIITLECAQKYYARAARFLGATDLWYRTTCNMLGSRQRKEREDNLAAARNALGEEEYSAAWNEGLVMTFDPLWEYARQIPIERGESTGREAR